MDRIENPSYLAGRPAFRENLISNPWFAKKKNINNFQCHNFDFKRSFKGSSFEFWNLFYFKISF